jgi:ribosomal-protein-alanine N-acetyltransferase
MFVIKRVRTTDIDFVKQLETEAELSVWAWNDYLAEIDRPDSIFLIVKENGENLGFILAHLIRYFTNNSDDSNNPINEIEIYNIAVKKKLRGKSMGTILLDKLTQIGKTENACKINLEVRKSNIDALNFYKKNRFEVVGLRRSFYSNPTEDAVLMTRTLV